MTNPDPALAAAPTEPPAVPPRKRFRLYLDGGSESAWCEHMGGTTYRALNACLSSVPLKLPQEALATLPVGHPTEEGRECRVHWGHLIECKPLRDGVVEALHIIGMDETPSPGEKP